MMADSVGSLSPGCSMLAADFFAQVVDQAVRQVRARGGADSPGEGGWFGAAVTPLTGSTCGDDNRPNVVRQPITYH